MDFHSLNRRQLQSLCKLNKIPANITNLAMADALKSLNIVEGVEEILNSSRSETVGSSIESPEKVEVMSPRVPRTSCRTSTRQKVKKTEVESIPVTASRTTSRGVRRNIGGDVNEIVKTPSVTSTRKKVPMTASRQNVLTQLNECEEVEKSECLVDQEKKCIPDTPAAVGTCNRRKVTTASARQNTVKKETTVQGVYSTRRSTRLTAKKSAELGAIEKERNEPVKISSFSDEVSVTSVGDLGDSMPQKSSGSGSGSIETSHESSVTSDNTEDNVEEESAESYDVGVSKEKVEDICSAFEKLDVLIGDQNLMAEKPLQMDVSLESVEEKEDCTSEIDNIKVNSVEIFEHYEKFDDLDEKSGQVDILEPDSEGISAVCEDRVSEEKLMVIDERNDLNEALNVSDNELNAFLAPKEHSEGRSVEVDDLKQDSEYISNPYKDGDSMKKMMVIDGKNDQNEALNVSVNEPNAYLAPEEHVEEKIIQVDNLKQDSEVIFDVCEDGDSEEKQLIKDEKIDLSEAMNVSVKEQNAYLAETDGTDADAVSIDTENPSDPSKLISEDMSDVLEMKNEVSECIGSPNMVGDLIHFKTENSSELSKLDNTDNLNVVEEMTVNNIEQDISNSTVNVVHVIPDELDPNMDFEAPKEAQVSLINETHVYLNSELNQETETKADADKVTHESVADVSITKENQFSAEANDVIDRPTLSEIPASIKEMTQISDNNENSGSKLQAVLAEEDKNIIEKTAKSMSIRQLKKQLKALSLKSNVKTNKDDMVVEARPALQAVCENQLATEELDN